MWRLSSVKTLTWWKNWLYTLQNMVVGHLVNDAGRSWKVRNTGEWESIESKFETSMRIAYTGRLSDKDTLRLFRQISPILWILFVMLSEHIHIVKIWFQFSVLTFFFPSHNLNVFQQHIWFLAWLVFLTRLKSWTVDQNIEGRPTNGSDRMINPERHFEIL